MSNPFTYAPMVAEELAEVPMLGVYGIKGYLTGNYTDFKFQAVGILIPGVSKTTVQSLGRGLDFTSSSFGSAAREKLRKSFDDLGMDRSGFEAHHIVPVGLAKGNEIVQSAILGGFKLNGANINGELLDLPTHRGTWDTFHHNDYNQYAEDFIDEYSSHIDPSDFSAARNFVEGRLIPHLKSLINYAKDQNITLSEAARIKGNY